MELQQDANAPAYAPANVNDASLGWDEDALWQRVLERDGRADGAFVYAVLSTRIYCRASCPARRPRREGVRFFATPQEAAGAGFRACKRCRPDELADAQVARVHEACRLIEESIGERQGEPLTLEDLSRAVGASLFHLQRTFKQVTGISPREYADARRLERLKAELHGGEAIVSALYGSGYGSSRALYERTHARLGMTPATYGRGGRGARIRFATAPCSLGTLLVAATASGVCSIGLGDSSEQLEADLRAEFPAAHIEADEAGLSDFLRALLGLVQGREPHLSLPLDVQATAFQRRVWQELQKIGPGETRTYTQVAQQIGQPTAARAVARACATNPVALAVPCHRVLREGGALAGYRWGLERKQKLLAQERAQVLAAAPQNDPQHAEPADEPAE